MTIPREALRLEGDVDRSQADDPPQQDRLYRPDAVLGARQIAAPSNHKDLCGYIFKSKSPSSGMARIKVHGPDGKVRHSGVGIWAAMFMEHFPWLPVEDEGRLHDPKIRENFIGRVFTMKRFRDAKAQGANTSANLISFHTRHKLLFMAHSPQLYRETGRLVAQRQAKSVREQAWEAYLPLLAKGFVHPGHHEKARQCAAARHGLFQKTAQLRMKNRELLEIIGNYANQYVPLVVPVTLAEPLRP